MSFLYPFLDESERDAGALLDDLARSAIGKAEESARLKALVANGLKTRSNENW